MKLLSCLCVFILSSGCIWQEIYGQLDATKNIVFPKDRKQLPSRRIVGGQEVTPHSFPFQVGLFIYTSYSITSMTATFCGGTLISTEWVLTAAHCVDDPDIDYIQVNLGSHYVLAKEETRLVLNSVKFVHHPGWNPMSIQNDIALVKLPINVTLNKNISTVQFAKGRNTYADQMGYMLGWGLVSDYQTSLSSVLRIVNSSILTNEVCNSGYFLEPITSGHICVSGKGPVGTCNGDSGGPLLVDGVQVGITSFGAQDCNAQYPSVFTRVSEYEKWIVEHIGSTNSSNNLHYSIAISIVLCLYGLFITI